MGPLHAPHLLSFGTKGLSIVLFIITVLCDAFVTWVTEAPVKKNCSRYILTMSYISFPSAI
ncbi:hypothetical protein C2G38_2220048 [Gigaspora rosea]|uniref:Uncharacterized protein n=1 Tax=Gigaspora rosea TaxID=44941 RepID=A0A397U4S5_9GLOM|nr:hypothetical protein C2G38_2220048 [Gigaspora rosea]